MSEYQHLLGRHTYAGDNMRVIGYGESEYTLTIGNFCSIAENVTFYLYADHHKNWTTTYPFAVFKDKWPNCKLSNRDMITSKGSITVGNDVLISRGASIMSGVDIGNGAIIAAHAVVTKCVDPYDIVGGNPAKIIGKRFKETLYGDPGRSDGITYRLSCIEWWNWPDEKIAENLPLLLQSPEAFVAKHYTLDRPPIDVSAAPIYTVSAPANMIWRC